jgi:hypothetical protein
MRTRAGALGAAIVWMAAITAAGAEEPAARRLYALTLFAGRMTDNRWHEIARFDVRFRDAYLAGLGGSRRVGDLFDSIDIELEAQAVRHFRGQSHWEVNGAVVGRWARFPWTERLPTSLAFGIGPSYATETPPEEVAREGASARLLVYWLTEVEVGLPGRPWSALARVHHRSEAFGAVADKGGSNWITLGIRRRF